PKPKTPKDILAKARSIVIVRHTRLSLDAGYFARERRKLPFNVPLPQWTTLSGIRQAFEEKVKLQSLASEIDQLEAARKALKPDETKAVVDGREMSPSDIGLFLSVDREILGPDRALPRGRDLSGEMKAHRAEVPWLIEVLSQQRFVAEQLPLAKSLD